MWIKWYTVSFDFSQFVYTVITNYAKNCPPCISQWYAMKNFFFALAKDLPIIIKDVLLYYQKMLTTDFLNYFL